jgi:hypothetical protein
VAKDPTTGISGASLKQGAAGTLYFEPGGVFWLRLHQPLRKQRQPHADPCDPERDADTGARHEKSDQAHSRPLPERQPTPTLTPVPAQQEIRRELSCKPQYDQGVLFPCSGSISAHCPVATVGTVPASCARPSMSTRSRGAIPEVGNFGAFEPLISHRHEQDIPWSCLHRLCW